MHFIVLNPQICSFAELFIARNRKYATPDDGLQDKPKRVKKKYRHAINHITLGELEANVKISKTAFFLGICSF